MTGELPWPQFFTLPLFIPFVKFPAVSWPFSLLLDFESGHVTWSAQQNEVEVTRCASSWLQRHRPQEPFMTPMPFLLLCRCHGEKPKLVCWSQEKHKSCGAKLFQLSFLFQTQSKAEPRRPLDACIKADWTWTEPPNMPRLEELTSCQPTDTWAMIINDCCFGVEFWGCFLYLNN